MGIESRYEKFREEPKLKDYLEMPERLQELSVAERQQLLEKAEAMAIEAEPGPIKDKYRRLFQAIKNSLLSEPSFICDLYKTQINDEYDVMVAGNRITLKTRAGEIRDFSDLAKIGLETRRIDRQQSGALGICITGKDQQCWINLRLFIITQIGESVKKRYLYIADRYVIEKLRGNKIGEQLLEIADNLAKINNCDLIFATLIPENFQDKEKLEMGHKKAGYEIVEEKDGGIFAIKKLNKS